GRHLASLILSSPGKNGRGPSWPGIPPQDAAPPQDLPSNFDSGIGGPDLRPPTSDLYVDVLVMGGGTGGAPAGIAAARAGKTTLVAEYLSGLGGVGTLGLIGKYWFGNRVGFTAEVDQGARELTTKTFKADSWDVEAKMQ